MMRIFGWSGMWPTNEFPSDGTRIKYRTRDGDIKESTIRRMWCGIEPVIDLDNGDTVFVTLDKFEVIK